MSANPHWARWIFASISKHLSDRLTQYQVFIEGQSRTPAEPENLVEIRMDGPYYTEESKDFWRLYIELSVLTQSVITDTTYHTIHRMVGDVAAAFTDTIPVYKYGASTDDTQTLLGCLELIQDIRNRERIQTNHFGQIDPAIPLLQATVEAHYEMYLEV